MLTMPTYNVHIYREMRILYQGVRAPTPEAAAESCRDFPSDAGCDPVDCDGQTFAAVVDLPGDNGLYHRSKDILFEEGRLRYAAPKLLTALKGTLFALDENKDGSGPSKQTAIANARAAIVEAEPAGISPAPGEPASKPYSVLLLYPDWANDGGTETYYAFVEAPDPTQAVGQARRQALAANEWTNVEPDDFAPLLVTEGHHFGQPISNQ
jgi:hypothetical protein